jgi:hypothetical protein
MTRRPRTRPAFVICMLAVIGAASVPCARAGPRWTAPVVIGPGGGQASDFDHPFNPEVAMNDRGDASLIWNTWEGQLASGGDPAIGSYELKERRRPRDGTAWSLPVDIADTVEPAHIRLDADGNASVFFWAGYIRVSQRAASENQWLTRITLSPRAYGSVPDVSAGVNDRGDAIAAWVGQPGYPDPHVLEAAVRIDGAWSPPAQLPAEDPNVFFTAATPQV